MSLSLEDLVRNFPYEQLVGILPDGALNFAASLDGEDSDLTEEDLAKTVASTVGAELVFDDGYRASLIAHLSAEQLVTLFPELDAKPSEVVKAHYDVAEIWAEHNLPAFAEKLNVGEALAALNETKAELESIVQVEPLYGLYPYQKTISDEVNELLGKSSTRLMVHLPTGAGKTRTAMNIVAQHLRANEHNLVLWLADREELCTQAMGEFKKSWRALGNRPCKGYAFYSESDVSLSGVTSGCVVAGLQKLMALKRKDESRYKLLYQELLNKVTLVVFDEAHKAVAKEYSALVEDFVGSGRLKASLIGLSATPGRSFSTDGVTDEDKALADFFGGQKVEMSVRGYLSPIDYLVTKGFLAKAEFKSLTYEQAEVYGYSLEGLSESDTNKKLAENIDRNRTIRDVVVSECRAGHQVIVFANSVDHARKLSVALNLVGIRAASVDSSSDSKETRRSKIQRYKSGDIQVLTNYGVLVAGFDAPCTKVAVIAKPTTSLVEYLQMAGRAMRGAKSGGNETCTIYTVLDHIPAFNNISIGTAHWNNIWKERIDD